MCNLLRRFVNTSRKNMLYLQRMVYSTSSQKAKRVMNGFRHSVWAVMFLTRGKSHQKRKAVPDERLSDGIGKL